METVGVLALQGDYSEHLSTLDRLNVSSKEVRTVEDLAETVRLIIPGGESTTMMKLLASTGLDEAIIAYGKPILGTCAGAIVLGRDHLGLLDITLDRNAYGSQLRSFQAEIAVGESMWPVSFIRAPKITSVGSSVEVLTRHDGHPVLVRSRNILAATFHTEVTGEGGLHEMLLSL